MGKKLPPPNWEYHFDYPDLQNDTVGILWSKKNRRGKLYMEGKVDTDVGELEVVGFPFVTRRFQTGLAILLRRDFHRDGAEGTSVRSDGEVRKEKRGKKVKDADA